MKSKLFVLVLLLSVMLACEDNENEINKDGPYIYIFDSHDLHVKGVYNAHYSTNYTYRDCNEILLLADSLVAVTDTIIVILGRQKQGIHVLSDTRVKFDWVYIVKEVIR